MLSNQEVFAISLDAGAIIVDFNETASKISGYSKDEVIGKNWFEVFIPDENILDVLKVFNDLFHGKNLHWEHTNSILCKDGTSKTIKWINNIIKDHNQKPKLIYSLGTEVS